MNIIDIAKLAGVSKSTVSRYLNNGYVSEDAKEKIKKILEETGFVPQRQAKSMRTKKTNLIGVIVPKISTETPSRVVEGITEVLSEENYDILIANTSLSIKKELEYLKLFRKNQVDGIIFMATKITEEHIEAIKKLDVPIVIVAQNLENVSSVYFDEKNATEIITEYLIEKKHTNIGFIGVYEEDKAVGAYRKEAFIDTLNKNNLKVNLNNIKIGDFSENSAYNSAKELMENNKEKPTAILTVTDNLAVGVVEYLKSHNYKIPEDVAVASMGDSKLAKILTPKLTTVHYSYKTSGRESAKIMMKYLKKKETEIINLKLFKKEG